MKKNNILVILSTLLITGGLLSSCQKEDSLTKDQTGSSDLKNTTINCEECVETWAETIMTFNSATFVPQSPNIGVAPADLILDIYNDETTIYYHIYRTAGTIQHLSINGNVIVTYGDAPLTEYNWQVALSPDWEACDDFNDLIIVGGVTVHGGHFTASTCYYLRDICETVIECDGPSETAWTAGARYTPKGNWATYSEYNADTTVDIYAGQHILIGTAHFSAVVDGMVTIHIELVDGWQFKDVNESLKINGYATPPSGNPSPGQFPYKSNETGPEATVSVPAWAYYGIHIDAQHCE